MSDKDTESKNVKLFESFSAWAWAQNENWSNQTLPAKNATRRDHAAHGSSRHAASSGILCLPSTKQVWPEEVARMQWLFQPGSLNNNTNLTETPRRTRTSVWYHRSSRTSCASKATTRTLVCASREDPAYYKFQARWPLVVISI